MDVDQVGDKDGSRASSPSVKQGRSALMAFVRMRRAELAQAAMQMTETVSMVLRYYCECAGISTSPDKY
jgi:hypothetical protein